MSWTQERVASALSDLDAPEVDEAFWERVRSDLRTHVPERDEVTIVMSPSDQMAKVHTMVRSPWRLRWNVAAGVAAAMVIAALYAVGHTQPQTPAASPTPADVVLTDLLSLSLDDQPRTGEPMVSKSDYLLPDLTQLPQGWTTMIRLAFGAISPPGAYRADYSLVSPTGASYSLRIWAGFHLGSEGGEPVDINGHAGLQEANHLWWEQQPGVEVFMSPGLPVESNDPTETGIPDPAADVVAVARSLAFSSVTELPIATINPGAVPPTKVAQFVGTLNGIRYAVQARTGTLRGIWVYIGDRAIAGVAEDRLSQPTDDPQTAGSVSIAGAAGYGVIVFGYTEPATAGLRANLADGTTIDVPVLRNPGETYFALPIPLGVEVVSLDFLDFSGNTLRTATMPTLPAYFGECCATAWWTT